MQIALISDRYTTSSPKSFSAEYKYCPFCGKELDFSGLNELFYFIHSFDELCEKVNLTDKQIKGIIRVNILNH